MSETAEQRLYILCGLPFAGKSTLARRLVETLNLAFVDIDSLNSEFGFGLGGQAITPEQWTKTYNESYRRLAKALSEGRPVVYNAANFTRQERDRARAIAAECGVPATVIYGDVPLHEVVRRWQENRVSLRRSDVRDDDFWLVVDRFESPDEDERQVRYNGALEVKECIRHLS